MVEPHLSKLPSFRQQASERPPSHFHPVPTNSEPPCSVRMPNKEQRNTLFIFQATPVRGSWRRCLVHLAPLRPKKLTSFAHQLRSPLGHHSMARKWKGPRQDFLVGGGGSVVCIYCMLSHLQSQMVFIHLQSHSIRPCLKPTAANLLIPLKSNSALLWNTQPQPSGPAATSSQSMLF